MSENEMPRRFHFGQLRQDLPDLSALESRQLTVWLVFYLPHLLKIKANNSVDLSAGC